MDLNDLLARHAFDRSADHAQKGWYHSIELNDGSVLEGVVSLDTLKLRLSRWIAWSWNHSRRPARCLTPKWSIANFT